MEIKNGEKRECDHHIGRRKLLWSSSEWEPEVDIDGGIVFVSQVDGRRLLYHGSVSSSAYCSSSLEETIVTEGQTLYVKTGARI